MINQEQKNKVLKFLRSHPVAVLATADLEGNPAAAVIYFAETDDFELVFGTHPSRKYNNLEANPKVALAMTKGLISVQYHGQAAELAGQALEQYTQVFLAKHPRADKHLLAGTKYIRVSPSWLRYSDMSKKKSETFEIIFTATTQPDTAE